MPDATRSDVSILNEPQPNRRRILRVAAAAAGLPLAITGLRAFAPKPELHSWRGEVLGALSEISLWHSNAEFARLTILKARLEMERLEKIFSLYRSDSEIVRLNGIGKLTNASPELLSAIEASQKLSQLSGGAF